MTETPTLTLLQVGGSLEDLRDRVERLHKLGVLVSGVSLDRLGRNGIQDCDVSVIDSQLTERIARSAVS